MSKIENHEGFSLKPSWFSILDISSLLTKLYINNTYYLNNKCCLFKNHKLTLGLSIPFDSKNKEHIDFNEQVKFAQQAERLGFTSLFGAIFEVNALKYVRKTNGS
jgi:hypothetical protein